MEKNISFKLRYWRQNGPKDKGAIPTNAIKNEASSTPG